MPPLDFQTQARRGKMMLNQTTWLPATSGVPGYPRGHFEAKSLQDAFGNPARTSRDRLTSPTTRCCTLTSQVAFQKRGTKGPIRRMLWIPLTTRTSGCLSQQSEDLLGENLGLACREFSTICGPWPPLDLARLMWPCRTSGRPPLIGEPQLRLSFQTVGVSKAATSLGTPWWAVK